MRHHHNVEAGGSGGLLPILAVAIGVARTHGIGVEYFRTGARQFEDSLRQLRLSSKRATSLLDRRPTQGSLDMEIATVPAPIGDR